MKKQNKRFEGKTVIVTGAGQGMGKAVALAFGSEGAGVVICDIHDEAAQQVAREIESNGGKSLWTNTDVSDKVQVDSMIAKAINEFGTIDVLVNNAGLLYSTPVDEISEDEWDLVLRVNLKSVFLCSRAVLPVMKAKKNGKIVNMSSSAGRSTSELGGAHYTTSKAGLLGFSRHLARETAPYGINVNAICPGLICTPMISSDVCREKLEYFIGQIPMKRLGKPEEAADLVLFLSSEQAAYITGATIDFNGGSLMM